METITSWIILLCCLVLFFVLYRTPRRVPMKARAPVRLRGIFICKLECGPEARMIYLDAHQAMSSKSRFRYEGRDWFVYSITLDPALNLTVEGVPYDEEGMSWPWPAS